MNRGMAVKEAIKGIKREEWQSYERNREIAETTHTMNMTWTQHASIYFF